MIKEIIYLVFQLLFIPHIIIFAFSKNKDFIIKDLYSRKSVKRKKIDIYYDLSKELLLSKYFRTLFYFRINNIFSKTIKFFYPSHCSFIIDINTKIGAGVKLAHPYSTIINAKYIGNNLYINQLVTIGEKNGKKPIIGDNVELHANSIIIGDIAIGDNVIVGAGAVVVKNIPNNAVVVGNPARIIKYINKDDI